MRHILGLSISYLSAKNFLRWTKR